MKIIDALRGPRPIFSFEFFPPKDEEGLARLFETLSELKQYEPAYVSVTYGAGGSTRHLTVDLVRRIKEDVGIETMAHLTCVGADQTELAEVLESLREANIQNVLPLRGDPPQGSQGFVRVAGGFAHASELVSFIRSSYNFCLAGACYPEKHPDSPSFEEDLDNLKRKVDSGVDFLITQLFFDNQDYFRFVDRARKAGIEVPIVAGIMPVTNVSQLKRFTQLCGASIPKALLGRLESFEEDRTQVRAVGVEHATAQCEELLRAGAPGIHFYTLNRALATREILDNLRARGL